MSQTIKRAFLWNAVGNTIYLLCQWLITVLVPVLGGFEDAGVLSVAMSVSATFQTVALFGIRSYQVSDMEGEYSDSCYVGLRSLTCLLALVLCVVFSLVNRYFGSQLLAIFLFMMFRLAENYSDVFHGIAQKKDRLDIAGKAFSIKGIGFLLCFLLGYALTENLNLGLLLMTLFSCGSTLLYDLPQVRKLSDFRLIDSISACGKLAMETLPLCIYLFFYAAISTLPKLILEKQCGEALLGAYASIFAPAMLLQSAAGYLYNPFATKFAEYRRRHQTAKFNALLMKIMLAMLGIAAAVMVAAQFLGEYALVLVFHEQIREYVYMLNPILIVNFAVACLGFFCMLVIVLRKFRWLLAGCGTGFVLCLVLTTPAIHLFGANGASYSLIVAAVAAILILLVCIILTVRKDQKLSKEEQNSI